MRFVITGICVLIAAGVGLLTVSWYFERSREKPYGVAFELVAADGSTVTEQAFRGHPTAVFFGYTHCEDVCPTTLFEMGDWLNDLGEEGNNIRAWFVTVDPERDTPAVMQSYLGNFSERIAGVTGNPAKVHAMLKGFSIYYKKTPGEHGHGNAAHTATSEAGDTAAASMTDYGMAHTSNVLLLDSHGRLFGTIDYQEPAESAETKLRSLAQH